MASLNVFKNQFFDANGVPLSGGKVYTYAAGATTPKSTYTDSTGATPNTNPVILNSRGEADIWLSGTYKINLTDANDVQVTGYPVDNVAQLNDSSNVTFTPSGTGAVATTVSAKLRKTACDLDASGSVDAANESSLPCYAIVSVNLQRTVIDKHAFEDRTTINTSGVTPLGYCSFDAKPTFTNTTAQLHLVGYQSRSTFAGSANLNQYWHGYDTAMVHNGAGVIAEASGLNVGDITGTGKANITTVYGVYIATQTAGATAANRWGVYSDLGNTHYFGGTTGSIFTGTIQAAGLNYNVDSGGKSIAIGFGTAGQTQFGAIDFYNGKNTKVASISNTALTVTGLMIQLGKFTNATLPAGTEGAIAYATNGRKIGEGGGAGTGVPVYWSNAAWKVFGTDATVTF